MSRPCFMFGEPNRPFHRAPMRPPMGIRARMFRPNMRHPGFRHHLPVDFIRQPRMQLPHRAPLVRPFPADYQIRCSPGNGPARHLNENEYNRANQNFPPVENNSYEQKQETPGGPTNYSTTTGTKRQFPTSFLEYCESVTNFERSRPDPDGPHVLVFVGNIPDGVCDQVLSFLFTCCGHLINWKRASSRNKFPQTFGLCEFGNPEAAMRCIRLLHDFSICDKKLVVKADAKATNIMETYKENQKQGEDNSCTGKISETTPNVASEDSSKALNTESEHPDDKKALNAIDELLRKFRTKILKGKERIEAQRSIFNGSLANNDTVSNKVTHEISKFRLPSQNSEDIPVEPNMKDLVSQEIGKFRHSSQNCPKHLAATLSQLEALTNTTISHKTEKRCVSDDPESTGDISTEAQFEKTRSGQSLSPEIKISQATSSPAGLNSSYSDNPAETTDNEDHRGKINADPIIDQIPVQAENDPESDQSGHSKNRPTETRRYFRTDGSIKRKREQEEEEARRMTIQQNIERQKEKKYQKRLKIWLDREARKASEKANKKDERKDEQADQSKLRVHLLKFFEKYNDYEDDAQFYRGQEWARRKKNRRKEEEYDRNDRRKEEEEIKKNLDINGKRKRDDKIEYEQKKDDIQQRNKYCENVCEETTDNIENEAVTSDLESQKKDTEIDGNNEKTSRKTDEERELKNKVREKLLQNKLAEENNLTKCEEEDDSSLKTSDSEPNQIYEQNFLTQTEQIHHMKPNTNAQSGTNGDLKPLKVLKKKQKGVSKSSNLNKNGKSSLTKKGKQKQQNTSGRTADTTISDLERLTHSNPNQRDNAEFKAVEAANYTKNSSNEEEKEDASSRQFNGGKEEKQNYKSEKQNKKEYIDSLIAEIPQDKLTLFAYRIRWDLVDQTLLKRRVVGWIGRKLEQYTGKQNEMVVDYICSKLLLHSSADVVMSLLSNVLMEKTEAFVVKLWKLMIYEVKYKEFCTENKE